MYSYILFDWDGCIADTLHLWIKAYEHVLPRYGLQATPETIWEKLCIGNVPRQFGVVPEAQCVNEVRSVAKTLFLEASLYDNAKTSLMAIANWCQLAIVSNGPSQVMHSVLERHNIKDLFASVMAKEDMQHPKPSPDGLIKAMETLGANPKQTLFVGDSAKDLEAARRAHIDSALFYPDRHTYFYDLDALKAYQPTYIVQSFQALEQLIVGRRALA